MQFAARCCGGLRVFTGLLRLLRQRIGLLRGGNALFECGLRALFCRQPFGRRLNRTLLCLGARRRLFGCGSFCAGLVARSSGGQRIGGDARLGVA